MRDESWVFMRKRSANSAPPVGIQRVNDELARMPVFHELLQASRKIFTEVA